MTKLIFFIISALMVLSLKAQTPIGAWEKYSTNINGAQTKTVAIYTNGFYVTTTYNPVSGEFVSTEGGSWTLNNNNLSKTIEFNSENPADVGSVKNLKVLFSAKQMEIGNNSEKFNLIDDGKPGQLHGAWLMSGRIVEGKEQSRNTSGPRKTMKILSGTRFQWIAYNIESKEFMGTGGGTYTTENGKYSETIEFFSKDNSRVGLTLKFYYTLQNSIWKHMGLSSKSEPINEIWSKRK